MLALVIGAAGIGNALGSVIGNRRGGPEPERLATGVAVLAVVAALLTAVLYSLPTLVLLGLATGLYGQLAKLSLDALIQRDVDDRVRARVFSWSETILQACWVIGGGLGIVVPLRPALGFALVTALVVGAALVAVRSRRLRIGLRRSSRAPPPGGQRRAAGGSTMRHGAPARRVMLQRAA